MKKFDNQAANMVATLVILLVGILVAASLVGTVAWQSDVASDNASVAEVPGGPALVDLWPLLFIIVPVLLIVKEVFF